MRFVIVGPGALGCLLAARLAPAVSVAGDDLLILDHDRERAELIDSRGIIYEQFEDPKCIRVAACADPQRISGADCLFLCVKSYDLPSALKLCLPLCMTETLVIFMQNGIAHLEFGGHVGSATAAYGCTSEGATLLGPGHVRHAGAGMTSLGFLDNCGGKIAAVLAHAVLQLQAAGLAAQVSNAIRTRLWAKLFVNVGINALTAIHNCRNGDLLTLPEAAVEMKAAVEEAQRVALAAGIPIEVDPYQATVDVCRATAINISSMRQDVLKHKRTEIDAINAAVVRQAELFGIVAQVNESLVRRIRAIEQGYGVAASSGG